MSERVASPEVRRNAAVRQVLADVFPGTRFRVRNGPARTVRVSWIDGPTESRVELALLNARRDGVWSGAARLGRACRPRLCAVAFLRAHDEGWLERVYSERFGDNTPVPRGHIHQRGLARWVDVWAGLDAADVTTAEWERADMLLRMGEIFTGDERDVGEQVGRLVYHFAPALDAALT